MHNHLCNTRIKNRGVNFNSITHTIVHFLSIQSCAAWEWVNVKQDLQLQLDFWQICAPLYGYLFVSLYTWYSVIKHTEFCCSRLVEAYVGSGYFQNIFFSPFDFHPVNTVGSCAGVSCLGKAVHCFSSFLVSWPIIQYQEQKICGHMMTSWRKQLRCR